MTKDENRHYIFETLRSHLEEISEPLLLVNVEPEGSSRLYYIFNPFSSEEVTLRKYYAFVGGQFMEMICRYSQYADDSYENINGIDKPQLQIDHYDIDATIDRSGNFIAGGFQDIAAVYPIDSNVSASGIEG